MTMDQHDTMAPPDEQVAPAVPAALDAERSVLGGMMLSKDAIADCLEYVRSPDFYDPRHGVVFDAIVRLYSHGEPADVISVADVLEKAGDLGRVGGIGALYTLTSAVPTSAVAGHHAQIVADKATRRRLVESGQRIEAMGRGGEGETRDLLAAAMDEIDAAATLEQATVSTARDAFQGFIASLDSEAPRYVPTPWREVNKLMQGWRPGTLVILAARPSVGKSIVALNAARWLAPEGTVGFVSLEMSRNEIMARLIAQMTDVRLEALERGKHAIAPSDWKLIAQARDAIESLPLEIDTRSSATLAEVQAFARQLHRRGNMQALVVDYLQLMTLGRKVETREREVGEIARGLKQLAMDLQIPVIALAQVNRPPREQQPRRRARPHPDAVDSKGKRIFVHQPREWEGPAVSDLRESGALEQHADVVMLLHRDLTKPGSPLGMNLGKVRNGQPGHFELAWQGHVARAVSIAAPIDAVELDGMETPR